MVAKFKAIKPHPLNDDAMSKLLRDASKEFSKLCIEDREEVVTGWTGDKPKWKVRYWANQYQIGFEVYPTDPDSEGALKWLWLDLGTKAHEIRAKNAPTLAFPTIYKAGSTPNSLNTRRKSSGGPMAFAPVVHHPGTEARNWSKLLAKSEEPEFAETIAPWMEHVARASGHSMEK